MPETCHRIASPVRSTTFPGPTATARTALLLASMALWAGACDTQLASDHLASTPRTGRVASSDVTAPGYGVSDTDDCDCPGGTNYLQEPVHATECGERVCGESFLWYSCEETGWVFQGGECPEETPACNCPDGMDYLGDPVHGTECGLRVCGADFQWYSCEETGWRSEGGVCPDMGPCTVRRFIDTVDQLVDAAFDHDLTCANVRVPVDFSDPNSELSVAVRTRYDAEHENEGPDDWRKVFYDLQAANVRFFQVVKYIDFKRVNLSGATFERGCEASWFLTDPPGRTDLRAATFRGTVNGCMFIGADLRDAVFEGDVVQRSSFEFADITGTAFRPLSLNRNDFTGATGIDQAEWPTTQEGLLDLDVTTTEDLCAKPYRENGFGGSTLAYDYGRMLPDLQINDPGLVAQIEARFHVSLETLHGAEILFDAVSSVIGYEQTMRMLAPPWRSYLYESRLPSEYRKAAIFDSVDGRYAAYSTCDGNDERPLRGTTLYFLSLDEVLKAPINDALLRMLRADGGSAVYLDDPYGGRTTTKQEPKLADSVAGFASAEDWYAFLRLEGTNDNRIIWNGVTPNYKLEDVGLSQATVSSLFLSPAAAAELQALAQDGLLSVRDLADTTHRVDIVAALFDHYRGI
jgi:hypothetical protein